MAIVKIEMSEWKAMEANKELLEKSLEREKTLNDQIKVLQDEKIKALEDAKMKVVKISKSEITEHKLAKVGSVAQLRERLISLLNVIGDTNNNRPHYYNPPFNENITYYLDSLFDVVKTTNIGNQEITTHGLDDIKSELRDELESSIKEEITSLKSTNKHLSEIVEDGKKTVKTKDAEIKLLNIRNEQLTKEVESLQTVRKRTAKIAKEVKSIKEILTKLIEADAIKVGIFNRGNIEIVKLIKQFLKIEVENE